MCLKSNERKSICVNSLCFVSCSYFRFYGPIKRYQRFEGVVYIFRVQIKNSTQYLGAMSWRLYLASSAPRTWH